LRLPAAVTASLANERALTALAILFSAGLDIGDATHGGSEDFGINTDGTATMHDATALDLGVPRDLAGEAWPDTNACVPNGQTEICDGEADDDCDGLPDDKDPDCTCSDGILSGQETDRDCGGPECPPCSHGSACTRDSDCDASSLLVCRGDEPKRCAIPASCLQIKNLRADLSTGPYVIECSLGAPMLVRCDMETDGGGWTEITLSAARVALNGQLVAVESAAKAGFDTQHRPYTLDADGAHTYHYSFDFPCGFSEFFLLNFAARSALATEGAGSSEINVSSFVQRTWNQGYFLTIAEPAAGVGDISFGAGDQGGPITSFAQLGTTTECDDCELPWPGGTTIFGQAGRSTVFRIGWGEAGTQAEGWFPWFSGTIMLR
jgi:hypothetical protein